MSIFSALTGGGLRSPQKIRLNGRTLAEILAAHALFVGGKDGGVRADLAGADLTRADLYKANLAYADLQGANLEEANLREAKLSSADLSKSYLRSADLRKADLTEANLKRRGFDGCASGRRGVISCEPAAGDFAARGFRSGQFSRRRCSWRGF